MESVASRIKIKGMEITSSTCSVLLLDEDKDSGVKKTLQQYPGFNIKQVADSQELQQQLQEPFDVILIDFTLEKNRENPILISAIKNTGKPFIAFSEKDDRQIDLEAMKSGASAYFTKNNLEGPLVERTIRYVIEREKTSQANLITDGTQNTIEKLNVISHIARTIAHEVRNPLTNINLSLEQLKNDILEKNETLDMYFDIISRNCERINTLISELLNATKPALLEPVRTSLNEITEQAISMAEDKLKGKEINLEKDFSRESTEVNIDSNKVKLAIFNILLNAIDAVENKKGNIQIKTLTQKDNCVLTITDNGSGINKENLKKIFDPFYSGRSHGTGLGLTASQNIILNHKGKIEVESEEGSGTKFTITFNKN